MLFQVGEGCVVAVVIVGGGQGCQGAVDGMAGLVYGGAELDGVAVLVYGGAELGEVVGGSHLLEFGSDVPGGVVDESVTALAVDVVEMLGVEVDAADEAVKGLGGLKRVSGADLSEEIVGGDDVRGIFR